tara:strand:- start:283967 stop:284470 length:504 start_codon:yes stop_codon:yes gene_type:complete
MKHRINQLVRLISLGAVCVWMGGCVCNKSEVHSQSSDNEVVEKITEAFAHPMGREDRLLTAMGLVDPRHLFLAVMEGEEDGLDTVGVMLTKPGCHRWPLEADSVLVLSFDEDGGLTGHERLVLGDGVRIKKVGDGDDGVHSLYELESNGRRRSFRRVFLADFASDES